MELGTKRPSPLWSWGLFHALRRGLCDVCFLRGGFVEGTPMTTTTTDLVLSWQYNKDNLGIFWLPYKNPFSNPYNHPCRNPQKYP